MSSHAEAPAIANDRVADNTDFYMFRSPVSDSGAANTVTIIANFIPLEEPNGGPNFYNFGDDVLYSIYIDNNGDAEWDIQYQFRFKTSIANPNTFLYNTGPIDSLTSNNWNMRQTYSVTRMRKRNGRTEETVLGSNLPCPPCRIGPRSTPNYPALADSAIRTIGSTKVFAGQRDEGFFVDLGSIFDLGTLRPVQQLHLIATPTANGKDGTKGYNVHTIALQVPISELSRNGNTPSDVMSATSVIGGWAAASRQRSRVMVRGVVTNAGPFEQVSRLGNPLINEVIIPLGKKDGWNNDQPDEDLKYLKNYEDPELQNLLPVLYPTAFPNLKALLQQPPASRPRADLVAILLTGLPAGTIPGFQNYTGDTKADMLRLNLAVPPSSSPNALGILGGDLAGYPNGRRVTDDVVAIELRAIAGATYPLVAPSYTPDGAASAVDDGLSTNPEGFLGVFPYLQHPNEGYEHQHD